MSRTHMIRVLTIVALAGALGLAGCGRKSSLDPPPSAQAAPPPPAAEQQGWRSPTLVPDMTPQQQQMTLPPARQRSFPLDPLLN
ncbi:lipoprotein [Rhodoplanes sp. TEM]|uniref:Lipoprotein n=1 Tax=Rhodoplanes tepidamans TaxID=200616 RepID=A0ABT5JBX5_RHOTP|nr:MULTISPECIES: lipoprotein [Rhodoplanes]MDC7786545.1 lipoprotein [Rhodoplanes tepidamans]MDC7983117.1 lipoprotein [Rhodoplanes sp. TEM]MDQ0357575.1 putative small lipoprotein YifL [Rhodoplanes tepidamans]